MGAVDPNKYLSSFQELLPKKYYSVINFSRDQFTLLGVQELQGFFLKGGGARGENPSPLTSLNHEILFTVIWKNSVIYFISKPLQQIELILNNNSSSSSSSSWLSIPNIYTLFKFFF